MINTGLGAYSSPANVADYTNYTGKTYGLWRELPSWCNSIMGSLATLFGSPQCVPMTDEEQRSAQSADLQWVCRNAADPQACVQGALIKSNADVAAATNSEAIQLDKTVADIECEQKMATESPIMSQIFGPDRLCKVGTGQFNTLLWVGGGLLLLLLLRPKRY